MTEALQGNMRRSSDACSSLSWSSPHHCYGLSDDRTLALTRRCSHAESRYRAKRGHPGARISLWSMMAASGREALARIAARAPGMVLLDIQMPLLSGWEVFRQLRDASLVVPVVF